MPRKRFRKADALAWKPGTWLLIQWSGENSPGLLVEKPKDGFGRVDLYVWDPEFSLQSIGHTQVLKVLGQVQIPKTE